MGVSGCVLFGSGLGRLWWLTDTLQKRMLFTLEEEGNQTKQKRKRKKSDRGKMRPASAQEHNIAEMHNEALKPFLSPSIMH